MKILYTSFHQGYGGGHDTYIHTLCRALSKEHEIIVAAPPSSTLARKILTTLPSIQVVSFSFKLKLSKLIEICRDIIKLRKLIVQNNFDIIHVNGSCDHTYVFLTSLFLAKRPCIIYTKHNSLKMKWSAKLRAYYFTDTIIAVSHYTKTMYPSWVGQKTPIKVIPNGVDTDLFKPIDKATLSMQWKLPQDALVLGSVAGTALYKGWWLLVEAVAQLRPFISQPLKIIIAGEMPSQMIMRDYVEKYNMQDSVIFTGLLLDVREVIAMIDIGFVLSYEVETISFACREMMAMGKPVMVSDYAGLPENITANKDGWITRCRNIDDIRQCLLDILTNKFDLQQMIKHTREKAINEFAISPFVTETLGVYLASLRVIPIHAV